MEKKRVAILSAGSRGGGSETFLRGLLPCLVGNNPEVEFHLFIAESKRNLYERLANNIVIHGVEDRIIDSSLKRILYDNISIYRELRSIKPNICFCTSEIFSPLIALLNIPVINVYHAALHFYMKPGLDEPRLRLWYIRFMRGVSIRLAKKTVAVSHFERAEIGGRYPKHMMDKIIVIYHGLDHSYFKMPLTKMEIVVSPFPFPYILCVADRHRHKKIDEMIAIYNIMHKNFEVKEHLVIVGRTKSKQVDAELSKLIKTNSLEDNIHFVDYIDNNEIRNYYWNSSLYWTHSACESFGLTPLEAMASGVPVLSVWRSALPEIYGDAAFFYNPYFCNEEEIAYKASSILKDENIRNVYIKRGLTHSAKFQWTKAAEEYQKVLDAEMIDL